jgi:ferredoxin-NADP reductase
MENKTSESFRAKITARNWLTDLIFEISLKRPVGFTFISGQKIKISIHETVREYTLINAPDDSKLIICVRYIANGRFTPELAQAKLGSTLSLSAPSGFFTYQSRNRKAIFVATGTGIAPFLAFSRAGVTDFILLHGVHCENDLIYREEITAAANQYIACLTRSGHLKPFWNGHVTNYMEECIPEGSYDFYLCGNREMICDAFQIIDRKFPGSRVFSEPFF